MRQQRKGSRATDKEAMIAYYNMRANKCNELDSEEERIEKEFWLAKARELE